MFFKFTPLLLALAVTGIAQDFALKDGDRVVFYGDSITDQRLYTQFTETFVRTRYPKLNVSFVHSGWGGDWVSGGGGGPAEVRVQRDVAAYKPTMVTVMFGMNDGSYHPFEQATYDKYVAGCERLIKLLREDAPGTRVTLIRPSPYDEVTRPPMKHGGCNPALMKFGDYLQTLAAREHFLIADLNAPVVKLLEKANTEDFELAQRILPDRVHPGAAGHLVMASALWSVWGADGVVSNIQLQVRTPGTAPVSSPTLTRKASVNDAKFEGKLISWTANEESLPMPVDISDPVAELVVRSSGFLDRFDREMLKVEGLEAGKWALSIDGQPVKVFNADELVQGVNLAALSTPMLAQAQAVQVLIKKRIEVHNARWRTVQVPLAKDDLTQTANAIAALDALDAELAKRIAETAQTKPHRFELLSQPADSASVH